ncbi:glycosyltransferase family 4 protein [Alcaligenes sp. SDU_A2]|uniref:glycosyltransferase family 4 protein n=1 Tax=Alcaligenes sp. SDU_A2 TaxID=3136634 RepID=UPI00311D7FFE
MTPLRILHSEAATSFGGQENYILRAMRILRERGHHVEAACQPHAQLTARLRDEGFVVHTLYMDGTRNYLRGVCQLRRVLRNGRFDVLNSHSRRDAMLAGVAGRLAGTPLIVRTRHLAKKVGSLLSYTIVPKRVITPSEYVRQHMIQRGVKPGAVDVVYPCVDPAVIDAAPALDLRAQLSLASDTVLVGCVAVLRREKGHRELIAAMQPLLATYPHLHLVLVGGGSPGMQELQTLVVEQGLLGRVHLLGPRSDVPSLLPNLDVFALATHMEASGTVFVEAGSAGLPVVGTRVGGVPEMMLEGQSGLLVPLHDIAALTQALESLILDPARRQAMGAAGRDFCRSNDRFTPTAMGDRLEGAYLRWLKELQK